MREHLLDVRTLEAPEPLEKALAASESLAPGEYVRMLHQREPLLLYPILEQRGFRHLTQPGKTSPYEILIWRVDDDKAETAVRWRMNAAQ